MRRGTPSLMAIDTMDMNGYVMFDDDFDMLPRRLSKATAAGERASICKNASARRRQPLVRYRVRASGFRDFLGLPVTKENRNGSHRT